MVTDTYSKLTFEMSIQSMLESADYNEDFNMLIQEQRCQHKASGRRTKHIHNGLVSPAMEGSFNVVEACSRRTRS